MHKNEADDPKVCACVFYLRIARRLTAICALTLLTLAAQSAFAVEIPGEKGLGLDADGRPKWVLLEKGLEFCEFRLNAEDSLITALKINPDDFEFFLGAASKDGKKPRTLAAWAKEYDLAAAVNASMYLPDNQTSTGYMRSGDHVNNPRITNHFGAFFVAEPLKTDLPAAQIIEKDQPDWRRLIDDYGLVIQNYRMTNRHRRILWSPGGPLYSISAVAQDGEGSILFLHSRKPVEAHKFVQQLLKLPLDIRSIMYVEGGAQAGLLVNSRSLKRDLAGFHPPSLLITGNLSAALPNILGIRRKESGQPAEETNTENASENAIEDLSSPLSETLAPSENFSDYQE